MNRCQHLKLVLVFRYFPEFESRFGVQNIMVLVSVFGIFPRLHYLSPCIACVQVWAPKILAFTFAICPSICLSSVGQGIIHTPHRGHPKFSGHPQDQTPTRGSSIASTVTLHYHGLNLISCGAMNSRIRHPALPPGCSSWGYAGVTGCTVTGPARWNRPQPGP